jgi:glutathione S-transferase
MLTVWGRKISSNVQALMWCIGELGLRFAMTSATNTAVRTRRNSWR